MAFQHIVFGVEIECNIKFKNNTQMLLSFCALKQLCNMFLVYVLV